MKSTGFSQLHSKLYVYIVAASCVALALVLSPIRARAQLKDLPPIIDRELFFGNPEISGAQISPAGKFIAFVKPFKGTRNIWVKRTADAFDTAKPITADTTRPIPAYFWSRDGKYILFVQDKAGDENYLVYAVNPLRSEEHTSELQSPDHLVCRLLLEKKNIRKADASSRHTRVHA